MVRMQQWDIPVRFGILGNSYEVKLESDGGIRAGSHRIRHIQKIT